jgi:hypothetical protein
MRWYKSTNTDAADARFSGGEPHEFVHALPVLVGRCVCVRACVCVVCVCVCVYTLIVYIYRRCVENFLILLDERMGENNIYIYIYIWRGVLSCWANAGLQNQSLLG